MTASPRYIRCVLLLAFWPGANLLLGQTSCVGVGCVTGTGDTHLCERIAVQPNLVLGEPTTINGSVRDESGNALRNSRVELRHYLSPTKQSAAQTVQTDENGSFHFKQAEPGQYRLIASPTRAFAQPEFLNCQGKRCRLDIALKANATDKVEAQCPVR